MGNRWDRVSDVLSQAVPGLGETVAIALVILGLLCLTLLVRTWFREDAAGTDRRGDLLTEMRELHREGGLSDEEFRLIKSRFVSAAAGGPGSPRQNSLPARAAESGGPITGSPGATAESAPSLQGRSDQPGQEAAGLPDGQS